MHNLHNDNVKQSCGIGVRVTVLVAALSLAAAAARAQGSAPSTGKFEVGGQLTAVNFGEFSQTDYGVGGRVAWSVTNLLAVEGQMTVFPKNLGATVAFSRQRLEGLLGISGGAQVGSGRAAPRVFGMVEPGFVRFGPSPSPVACVLIYPPPLTCTLADGRTEFALAIGGGVSEPLGARARLRLDLSDLLIHFNEPTFRDGQAVTSFNLHNLRVSGGIAYRF